LAAAGFFVAWRFGSAVAVGVAEGDGRDEGDAAGEDEGDAAGAERETEPGGFAAAAAVWCAVPLPVEHPQITTAAPVIQTGRKRTRTAHLAHSSDISRKWSYFIAQNARMLRI
jgi:hypothetical protein